MKYSPTLQKKRKAPKSSRFRLLHAVTSNRRKKKQRAATAAAERLSGEVPSVGVGRALIVIAIVHVVAIGGIWMHIKWRQENDLNGKPSITPKVQPAASVVLVPGGTHYSVQTGDNYFNVARKHGIDMEALKKANNFQPLSPGLKINLPEGPYENSTPSDVVIGASDDIPVIAPIERPRIQTNDTSYQPVRPAAGDMVEVDNAPPMRPDTIRVQPQPEVKPLLIKPRVQLDAPARRDVERQPARAVVVSEQEAPSLTHTVAQGETLWALSRKYGTTPAALMEANGITDATKVRSGVTLKIPQ